MSMPFSRSCHNRRLFLHGLLLACAIAPQAMADELTPTVEAEELITTCEPAGNGAGPTWCYGSTCVARDGKDVYVSTIETGQDVPLLCNTRWQLWHRTDSGDGWSLAQHEENYRHREPCPIGLVPGKTVFLSINPSTEPPGVKYGPCRPGVLEFDVDHLTAAPRLSEPAWAEGTYFTDHSYRGFATDGQTGELLLLNINAKTSKQFVSYRDTQGTWHAKGTITFPIRGAYPQVLLKDHAAYVLAIGDIVEPVKVWRESNPVTFKYVFRRLFFTWTPDIRTEPFAEPIEIDSAEATAGYIINLDLRVDSENAVHLLYTKTPHRGDAVHKKFFPGQLKVVSLNHAVLREGQVELIESLISTPQYNAEPETPEPAWARFHVTPDNRLLVVIAGSYRDKEGKAKFGNFLAEVVPGQVPVQCRKLELAHPFNNFFTNTPRGGSKPANVIDMYGTTLEPKQLRYARIRLK